MSWTLLQNSLLISGLATAFAVILGAVSGLWITALESRWRVVFLGAAAVTLALPPFLVTSCWLHLLGHTGIWRAWLPISIYSHWGTVWILSLMAWPITSFLVFGAWQRIARSQLESEPALQGWPLVRWLLFPRAKSALATAAVLTSVLSLNNFAVPAILQTKVFPAELWISFNTALDYRAALRLSWPLILAPMLLLLWLSRRSLAWPTLDGGVASKFLRRQLGVPWFWGCGIVSILLIVLAAGLPVGELVGLKRTWTELPAAFAAGKAALWNSLWLAAAVSGLGVAAGLALWRWRFGAALWIPFFVPGVLLGIALSFLLNRALPWSSLLQSSAIVLLGLTLRYLALGWSGATHAMQSIDPDLTDSAKLSGASAVQVLRHIQWPQIAPTIAAVGYVTYLFCLWDIETVVLIVPPGGETLALRIFNLLHYGWNDQVNALCLILLALALAPLALWSVTRWVFGVRQLDSALDLSAGIASAGDETSSSGRTPKLVIHAIGRLLSPNSCASRSFAAGLRFAVCGVVIAFLGCGPTASNVAPIHSQVFSSVQIIGGLGTTLGQFNKPRSVAVDAEDNLYVVDMTGRVQKFSPDGAFLLSWQMPQTDLGKPKGMCRDRDGNIVVIEPHYSRVNHFSPSGQLICQWGNTGTNRGELMFPRAAAVNSRGEIFLSEYGKVERVQKFSAQGKTFLQTLGEGGDAAGQFNRAEGLGLDRRDQLYVADSCNHRIQIFSPDGQYLKSFGRAGSGPGELSYPYDVQVDAEGRQYVCEFGNSRVQIFDEHGRSLEILGHAGSAPGQFANPWGLALDSKGNLYVADSRNHRVQKFLRRKSA